MGLAEAESTLQLGQYRPKANKQRGREGRGVGRSRMLRCSWGNIGRRLKSSETTRVVGSAKAGGCQAAGATRAVEPLRDERGGGDGRSEGGAEAADAANPKPGSMGHYFSRSRFSFVCVLYEKRGFPAETKRGRNRTDHVRWWEWSTVLAVHRGSVVAHP